MQQGRVQLDADWNEQAAIMQHALRSLVVDLAGPAWAVGNGFELKMNANATDFSIAKGRFYVDGIACDNPADRNFLSMPGVSSEQGTWDPKKTYLVYIDAWEQLVTSVEDQRLREVALGGPDTAARAQVMWQVRLLPLNVTGNPPSCSAARQQLAEGLGFTPPRLKAEAKADAKDAPCEIRPDAAFRGLENQLYRVEIHDPGKFAPGSANPSFKWSRENGSVVFPVTDLIQANGQVTAALANYGRDDRLGLEQGDWVELVDDEYLRQGRHDPLLRVAAIDRREMTVTLTGSAGERSDNPPYRLLRRWDQRDGVNGAGVIEVAESDNTEQRALALEDGVTVSFEQGDADYRTGDYWLIPARTATGDVEWPTSLDPSGAAQPDFVPAQGVAHHYGLLGVLAKPAGGAWTITSCRCTGPAGLASCPQ